jgi:hypothetical protein
LHAGDYNNELSIRRKVGRGGERDGGLAGGEARIEEVPQEASGIRTGLTGDRSIDSDRSKTGDRQEKESSEVGILLGIRGEASGWRLGYRLDPALVPLSSREGMRGRQSDECDRSSTPRVLLHRVTGFSTAKHAGREASNSTVSVLPKESWRRTERLEGGRDLKFRSSKVLVLEFLRMESSEGCGGAWR